MKFYRIRFTFESPLSFLNNPPTFDAIISAAIAADIIPEKEKNIKFQQLRNFKQADSQDWLKGIITRFFDIPLASQLQPAGPAYESSTFWVKRFRTQDADILKWGKGKKEINIASGEFKNRKETIPVIAMSAGDFFFHGDAEEVKRLVRLYIPGIGKNVPAGYGWFSKFEITEQPGMQINDILRLRPVPVAQCGFAGIDIRPEGHIFYGACSPPYWDRKAWQPCYIDKPFSIHLSKSEGN